jgi:hypothetical protein
MAAVLELISSTNWEQDARKKNGCTDYEAQIAIDARDGLCLVGECDLGPLDGRKS